MAVHLIKLAVGVEDLDHLRRLQAQRVAAFGRLQHITRNTPRRAADLLDGGSMYWVVKGVVLARQRLLDIVDVTSEEAGKEGRPACALILHPDLIPVEPRRHHPFQGWRYLETVAVPRDLIGDGDAETLPAEMAAELKSLGLL